MVKEVQEVQETFEQRLRRKGQGWVGPVWHLLANVHSKQQLVQVELHGKRLVVLVDGMERLVVHHDGPACVVVRQHE